MCVVALSQTSAQDKWGDLGYSERSQAYLEYNVENQFEVMDSLLHMYEKFGNWFVYKIVSPLNKMQVKSAKKFTESTFKFVDKKVDSAYDWVDEYGHEMLDDCFDEKKKDFDDGMDKFLDWFKDMFTDANGKLDTALFELKEVDDAIKDQGEAFDKNARKALKTIRKVTKPFKEKYLDDVDATVDALDGLFEFLIGGEDGIITSIYKIWKKTYYDELIIPIWDYVKKLSKKVGAVRSESESYEKKATWRTIETVFDSLTNEDGLSVVGKLSKGYYRIYEGVSGFFFKVADDVYAPLIPFKPPGWKPGDGQIKEDAFENGIGHIAA